MYPVHLGPRGNVWLGSLSILSPEDINLKVNRSATLSGICRVNFNMRDVSGLMLCTETQFIEGSAAVDTVWPRQ